MDFENIDIGELGRNIFAMVLNSTSTHGEFQDAIEECKVSGKQYTDESFPPSKESLINDWEEEDDAIFEKVPLWS